MLETLLSRRGEHELDCPDSVETFTREAIGHYFQLREGEKFEPLWGINIRMKALLMQEFGILPRRLPDKFIDNTVQRILIIKWNKKRSFRYSLDFQPQPSLVPPK